MKLRWSGILLLLTAGLSCQRPSIQPGADPDGGVVVSTGQLVRPAGAVVEYPGRPVDLAISPDGKTAYVKDRTELVVLDVESWKVRQHLPYPEKAGASMHGLAVSRDGSHVYVSVAPAQLAEATVQSDRSLAWGRTIALPAAQVAPPPSSLPEARPPATTRPKPPSYPCGVALSPDGRQAYVCLSMNNTLGVVDLAEGKLTSEIVVGVAPYDVILSADGKTAYVSNWGGRRAEVGERTAKSAGTDTLIDEHGVGASGTVSAVDISAGKEVGQIATGLHPADLALSPDGRLLYVANANSDTVSVIETDNRRIRETIEVRPDPSLPFGSASNALALSADGKRLFVANGGNNAIAVVDLASDGSRSALRGFIPAGWYPGAVVCARNQLLIANVKGIGSRDPDPQQSAFASRRTIGSVQKVAIPDDSTLSDYTRQVKRDALLPQTLRAWERRRSGLRPVPVPSRVGEPSVFEHVVYIIKENRTYDQVFGDLKKGNGEERLCIFPRNVTPNLHALAEQFVLLDNFYCNGVLSADGHAWATEGTAVDYLEKSFGGWSRSYPFSGDDPLAMAPTGFIWDNALLHGLSFRNYGEMARTKSLPAAATSAEIYQGFMQKSGQITLEQTVPNETLQRYTNMDYPGWNLRVPDAVRAEVFLGELKQFEASGQFPNLLTVFLPRDHTSGTRAGEPTPVAMVADNDLAVGRIVEAISRSRFWKTTCIFVIEDDPQAGFDHVDGHRSLCLAVSPYTRTGAVVSEFYNQTSVLHTMELMLGLPPMTQMDAMAPVMRACFTDRPNLQPYAALTNTVPLDQVNPPAATLPAAGRHWAEQSLAQNWDEPDRADENTLNRVLWYAMKGNAPYPAEWAGAHGRGLESLRLKLDPAGVRDEDD